MDKPDGWLTLAKVIRSRGRRGEVIAVSTGWEPGKFVGREVFLFGPGGSRGDSPVRVEEAWLHQERLILKFSGVDSIEEAEGLRGFEVRVPASERTAVAEGEYLPSQLVGCSVVDADSGTTLGVVEDWEETGGPLLLTVRTEDGGEMLVPFARSICVEIDVEARRIVARLPEGLKDLNR